MSKNLVIVESPAKAKTIEKYLGKDFHVLASYGHVRDLIPKEGAVDPQHDFAMKYEIIERNQRHLLAITKALKSADTLYLATDPDREGEAISWHLLEYLNEKNLVGKREVHRVAFHEITKKSVTQAIAEPAKLNFNLVYAQQARRALDYLVGFNLSPLLWKKIRRGLSAGRVQSPGVSGMTVSATNEIRIPIGQLKLDLPLSLKSGNSASYTVIKATPTGLKTPQELVDAINLQSTTSGVRAYIADSGSLVLTNILGSEGKDIAIDSSATPNALGLKAGSYGGSISITRALIPDTDTPIELGFANGTPADLSKIGFKTGTYISGTPSEDLLVFVTGAGEAKISASYSGTPISAKQAMRSQPLQVRFDSATHFTIVDVSTDTVVASRSFDPNLLEPAFTYQGIQVTLSNAPKAGDVFTIDGNKDGTGNNENMLQLVDLEGEPVMGGGKTFASAYIDNVNDLGNIARQATIAQSALKVVYDQAVSARDQVSGVSLDEEAADLVRYQQAYQAAAKILQVASQLFDSVLQVR
jgi:5S rRNA maturation endonuclease (ribonuclease M5)